MNGISCVFEARVSRDPELRYTREGKAVCNVGVGVPDGKGGVEWVRVALWEQLAEEMAERLGRGDQVYVEGRLRLSEWDTQDGQHRAGLEVNAWKLELLGGIGRREQPRQHDRDSADAPVAAAAEQPAYRQRIAAAAAEGTERAASRPRWGRR